MTVSNPQAEQRIPATSPQERWIADDEIDLREYVLVLVAWWREILFITILAALIGAAAVLAMRAINTPLYEAAATVAIARTKSDITFDERFLTVSESNIQAMQNDRVARRATLLGLVNNSTIAEAVIQELGTELSLEEANPAALLEMIKAEAVQADGNRAASDLIRIRVQAESPSTAAAIANSWAKHYVEQVNQLYGQVPEELVTGIEVQRAEAYQVYLESQAALENLIAQSEMVAIERAILENQRRLEVYTTAETDNALLAFQQDQAARQRIFSTLSDAELNSTLSVIEQQVQERLTILTQAYADKARLQRLVQNAQTLQAQMPDGDLPVALTNNLALLLLKTEAFAPTAIISTNLQINLDSLLGSELTASEVQADLAGLINALNERIAQLESEIAAQSEMLVNGEQYQFLENASATQLALSVPPTGEGVATDVNSGAMAEAIRRGYLDLNNMGNLVLAESPTAAVQPVASALRQEIQRMEQELQLLHARHETEMARKQQLTEQRDLAWSTLKTLQNKSAELALTVNAANSEVRFAAPAVAPLKPVAGPGLTMTVALAAVVGLLLALFVAFFANFMGISPFFSHPAKAPNVQIQPGRKPA